MAMPGWKPLPFTYITTNEILSAGIMLPIVCMSVVGLRLYSRKLQKGGLGIDDWLILPAVVMVTGMGACLLTGYTLGIMGYPTPLPIGEDPVKAAKLFLDAYITEAKLQFAFQLMQILGVGLTKISIIFFCRRVFLVHKRSTLDYATWVMIALNALWTIGFVLTLVFGCKSKVWLHWAPLVDPLTLKYCGDLRQPLLAATISGFILDLGCLILPLPSIWKLQITTQQKMGVSAIFLLGFMSVAASVIRLAFYVVVLKQPYDAGYDINQTVTTLLWWSFLETGLAVIAACLPPLQTLRKSIAITKFIQTIRDSTWLSSSSKTRTGTGSSTFGKSDGAGGSGSFGNRSRPDKVSVSVMDSSRSLVRSDGYIMQMDDYSARRGHGGHGGDEV